jgi:hypothetical protein
MPAFGKKMTLAEMDALVDFLTTLRESGQSPAEPPTNRGECRQIKGWN